MLVSELSYSWELQDCMASLLTLSGDGWASFLLNGHCEVANDEDVMNEIRSSEIYRVCGSVDRWDVYQEPKGYPVATFTDKAAALNYAMCLARGRVAWHLLLKTPETGSALTGDGEGAQRTSAAQH
jgi:hypothetical protein